jgi:PAS domain S-box-containing protein
MIMKNVSPLKFLYGGGEMGELIKNKNWSETEFGDPEEWSAPFTTTLSIMLNNNFPMFLFWGKNLRCFYNDAYKSLLGTNGKHPAILGMSAQEAWPEAWPTVASMIEKTSNHGESFMFEDLLIPIFRNGKLDDVYWTFSYSPVWDENLKVEGVLITCTETTKHVNAFRQLEESNQRFLANIRNAPVAMCVFRGENYIIEIANRPMLNLWDKSESDVLDKPFFDILPGARNQGLDELMKKVFSTGSKVEANEQVIELTTNGKRQKKHLNLVYQPIFEPDGNISGIITTAVDVSDQVHARLKIEESERKIRGIINSSPIPMAFLTGPDFRIELANAAKIAFWRKGPNVIGRKLIDILPEFEPQGKIIELQKVFQSGEPLHLRNVGVEIHAKNKIHLSYINYSFIPFKDREGNVFGILSTGADVTELQLSKQKLVESERQFKKIADSAPVLIWMCTPDKNCTYFNVAWLNFTGRSLEEEKGFGWFEGVHPEDKDKCLNIFLKAFDQREEFYMEYRLRKHDGSYRWISDTGVPRYATDGFFEGYIGACQDIHGQVTYQHKLKEDDEKLNLVIESSELGTMEVDFNTLEFNCSARFKEILGIPETNDFTYQDMIAAIVPEDRAIRERALHSARETGKLHFIVRFRHSDGGIRWIEAKGAFSFDAEKKPVKGIGTFRDITAEKQRQRELYESEKKFRLLADSINQIIWTCDSYGKVSYFNKFTYSFTQIPPEEFYEKGWEPIIHPEDFILSVNRWEESVHKGADFVCEHRLKRHDGKYRWHICRAIPQKDKDNNIQMWVCTSIDIHDQKLSVDKLEKMVSERTWELEKKNLELERMNKELQSFAYISSHDLQEPLRKIQTFSSIILEREFDMLSNSGKENFNRIKGAAERMQILIQDLLTYSRTNTEEKSFEDIHLNEILDEVKEELSDELESRDVILRVHNLCTLKIIPFQFRQLFNNLISNSIKFAKKDEQPIIEIFSEIALGQELEAENLHKDKTYCCIKLKDNGIGFDPEYNQKIFDVFQRLHSKKDYKGTGIGLAIVKKIVENHNGFIEAYGKPGEGCTFKMCFPVN